MKSFIEKACRFFRYLHQTIKDTILWFFMSYFIPILQIGILYFMDKESFMFDKNILSILIVTNASFYTALFFLIRRGRNWANVLTVMSYVVTVILFAFSVAEMKSGNIIFPIKVYSFGACCSFAIAFFLALIAKYDGIKAKSQETAIESRKRTSTIINGQTIGI